MENVKGTKSLIRRLDAVRKGLTDDDALEDWQLRTIDLAKAKHRPNKKTGVTSDSIQRDGIGRNEARVEAGGAAIFLEYGTKGPYPITPRRKPFLAWPAEGVKQTLTGRAARSGPAYNRRTGKFRPGSFIYARAVSHPGIKARPFLIPAAEEARDEIWTADGVYKPWNKAG